MPYTKPLQVCVCGDFPKTEIVEIGGIGGVPFIRYNCSCGKFTFATRQESFSRELWNSTMNRIKEMGQKITF